MRIILDVMGGDSGSAEAVRGAVRAREKCGADVVLVGREGEIVDTLVGDRLSRDGISIIDAQDVITMEDDPVRAVRERKGSSMVVGLRALKNGEGDGFITSGNTGAALTGATLIVGRIPGVRRAALGVRLPTRTRRGVFLIDCGANAECTPEYLKQFALMGSTYARAALEADSPRVYLINNGAEETKGGALQQESYRLLHDLGDQGMINFCGNMECRDIFSGDADVLVCDGFTGNAILKCVEGTGSFVMGELRTAMTSSFFAKLAALVIRAKLKPLRKMMDYREIGATPILGVAKPVFKAHGTSDALAYESAILQAHRYCASTAPEEIARLLSQKNG